jgi:hypothetical protein
MNIDSTHPGHRSIQWGKRCWDGLALENARSATPTSNLDRRDVFLVGGAIHTSMPTVARIRKRFVQGRVQEAVTEGMVRVLLEVAMVKAPLLLAMRRIIRTVEAQQNMDRHAPLRAARQN